MAALVSIGGFDFPEPSTYNATTSTIVDSARNIQGKVVGDVVRHDVVKIILYSYPSHIPRPLPDTACRPSPSPEGVTIGMIPYVDGAV